MFLLIHQPGGNKGDLLDEAALWNFAGRAGRLGEEIVGNVFLVNYENWDTQPLTERKPFAMKVAFKDTIESDFDAVMDVLDNASYDFQNDGHKSVDERVTAAAGLVLFRSAQGSLETLLGRSNIVLTVDQKAAISNSATDARIALGLPESVLTSSWMS